jgi:uncharacterized phage protein (TIGR01671 family)
MRKIKFRAWHPDDWKMYYFNSFLDIVKWQGGPCIDSYRSENESDEPSVSFMQYTGRKDKNGKEIYDGDIIFDLDFKQEKDGAFSLEPRTFIVEFNQATCGLLRKDFKTGFFSGHIGLTMPGETEVIGNIYENPELIS